MSVPLRILGRPNSSNVQKVLWCAREIGIPFANEMVGGKFGFPEGYSRINPNKLVPAIVDTNGFYLWESHAICKYLNAKYDGNLYIENDIEKRAQIDQWLDWQATALGPSVRVIFFTLVRTPEASRDLVALSDAIKETNEKLKILDRDMASDQREFIAGSSFSLADISVAISVHRWSKLVPEDEKVAVKNVSRWFESIQSRPLFSELVSNVKLT